MLQTWAKEALYVRSVIRVQKGWAAVDLADPETRETAETHILPVQLVPLFDTRSAADQFIEQLEAAGSPACTCVGDDGQAKLHTFFGHMLSSQCPCRPQREPNPLPMYVHAKLC